MSCRCLPMEKSHLQMQSERCRHPQSVRLCRLATVQFRMSGSACRGVCAEVAADLECMQQCSLCRTRMHEATPCSLLVSAGAGSVDCTFCRDGGHAGVGCNFKP